MFPTSRRLWIVSWTVSSAAYRYCLRQNLILPFSVFHDGLDYISVHQKIIEEVRAPLVGSKARQSLDNQVDVVVKSIAPHLRREYPSFFNEFKVFLRDLLQNHVLSVEDLVDVLTLKESPDFATALELVKNAKVGKVTPSSDRV